MAGRNDYQRVPVAEDVELEQRNGGAEQQAPQKPRPQGAEPPPSQAMVVFSVSFYLVAAIVVRTIL